METPGNDPRERRPHLVREVAILVIAGIVLGLAYNQSMLLADDTRALPWIAKERATGVLELPATDPAPSATATAAPVEPAATSPATATVTTPAPTPLATATSHDTLKSAKPAAKKTTTTKSAAATTKPATAAPPASTPAAPATTPKPAAAVPAIPDTREPLEVKFAIAKQLHDADGAIFVDARTAEEYAAGHIAGAISMPFDDVFKKPELAKALEDHGKPIITYCDGGDCTLSKDLAFSLIDAGHKKVLFYADGFPGWKSGGGAVHSGTQP